VGVTAYNEETNIRPLLDALLHQHLYDVEISEIIVVASGCTDNTVPIVGDMSPTTRRSAVRPAVREGKTAAINIFLANAGEEICVLESGDTLPHEDAVEHLVRMFTDPAVGMAGAHKIPVNTPDHMVGLFTHLRLRLEHQLCLEIPRLGEMIAFRKVFSRIPADVAMDEAFVEALVVKRGLSVRYAPDAVVYNTGPSSVKEFVKQRRRNHAGHLYQIQVRVRRIEHPEYPGSQGRPERVMGGDTIDLDADRTGSVGGLVSPSGLVRFRHQKGSSCGVGHGLVAENRCGSDQGSDG
jgi:cellulose synthase/poly-beta-1,6-N-acetylglucosamine synthase-like glycosyltransferase